MAKYFFVACAWLLGGCAVLAPDRPRARRHPTLEQARRWVEYNNQPRQRNKRYYRAYPR
ncbi:hypothetical protein [Hymenobacter ruricola]|uniref:Uncharacterized protein n=1 Tax=Hymenobacter ruricola TaxID=2791023 RepID=A0ABS0I8J4_9BACT|nr:hypothetical protein [Hymenobacter ruricola]MBF9223003.1 hypothetical protein [Hymenobacter ruricola]